MYRRLLILFLELLTGVNPSCFSKDYFADIHFTVIELGGEGRVCLSFSFRSVTLGIHFEPLILFEEIGRKKKTTTKAWFQHSKYFFKQRLDYLLWNYSLKEVLLCNSYVRRDYAKFYAQVHHLKRKICTEKEIEAQKGQRTTQGHLTSEWWGRGSEKGLSDSRLSSFF